MQSYASVIRYEEQLNAEFDQKEEDIKKVDKLGIVPTGATKRDTEARLDEISTGMDRLSDEGRSLIERIVAIGSTCERCSEPSDPSLTGRTLIR